MELAVGIDQPPHHLDDALAVAHVQALLEHAGEAIEVDRLRLGVLGLVEQALRLAGIELEMPLQEVAEESDLFRRHRPVDRDDMEEESCGSDTQLVLTRRRFIGAGRQIGEKSPERLQHEAVLSRPSAAETAYLTPRAQKRTAGGCPAVVVERMPKAANAFTSGAARLKSGQTKRPS